MNKIIKEYNHNLTKKIINKLEQENWESDFKKEVNEFSLKDYLERNL